MISFPSALRSFAPALVLAVSLPLQGGQQSFPEYKFSVTIPDSWGPITNARSRSSVHATFGSADKSKVLVLIASADAQPVGPLNDSMVASWERGLVETGGGTRVSGKFVQIEGLPAFERVGYQTIKDKRITSLIRLVAANNRLIQIQGMEVGGEAADDPEVKAAVESFHFTSMPMAPVTMGHSRIYRAFRLLIVALVLVGGAALLFKLSRKKGATSAPAPPLTPNS